MYRPIRIDKRIPDGSIWQARSEYLLPPVDGWSRTLGPAGTRWSNPLGGWTTKVTGMSLFHPEAPFTVSCFGPDAAKRFYIDIAYRTRIEHDLIEFVDLFLDVLIDADHAVSEKDEYQLAVLPHELGEFARRARDDVRTRIDAGDPLFDATSAFFAIPEAARTLMPRDGVLELF
ncbi:MAG TPA: DUF402 domain-containing protein [Candidatus Limnocylindria bacterium]